MNEKPQRRLRRLLAVVFPRVLKLLSQNPERRRMASNPFPRRMSGDLREDAAAGVCNVFDFPTFTFAVSLSLSMTMTMPMTPLFVFTC